MSERNFRHEAFNGVDVTAYGGTPAVTWDQSVNSTYFDVTKTKNNVTHSPDVAAMVGNFGIDGGGGGASGGTNWNPSRIAVSDEKNPPSIEGTRTIHKADPKEDRRRIDTPTLFQNDGKHVAEFGAVHGKFDGPEHLEQVMSKLPKNTQIMMEFVTKSEGDKINQFNTDRAKLETTTDPTARAELAASIDRQGKAVQE